MLNMPIRSNIVAPHLGQYGVMAQKTRERRDALAMSTKMQMKYDHIDQTVGQLSGGNQQKIVIAKWLGRKPSFIVLDEPTRGVDVGAKAEIHKLVKELADNGAAVLVISSDLPELLELSDLIHVVRDGKIAGTLDGAEATEKSVMSLAAGEKLVGA